MPTFNENFGFKESPFELYVAEREPRINEYAVKPPYFEETRRRISSLSSYILFGFRGSGKSATRITAEKETWKALGSGSAAPIIVTFTDFDSILRSKKVDDVTLNDIIDRVAFLTIEAILLWITNEAEQERLLELLDEGERKNFVLLTKAFYLNLSESERRLSQDDTMKILQQNWRNKSIDWANKKWSSISKIIGVLVSAISKDRIGTEDISKEITELLQRGNSIQSSRMVLNKLVDLVQSFGFSGVCVLIDKVDEHPKTQRSTEETAKLIYPILSQVQMMEIDNFAWIFFLWDKVKSHLSTEKLFARLDKYAHSDVVWPKDFLENMVNKRLMFFSAEKIAEIDQICSEETDAVAYIDLFINLVQHSPRELIRLLDVLTREFDSKYAHLSERRRLTGEDFDAAQDVYVRDVLWTVYDNRILSQLLRFNTPVFTNKDVQQAFRISPAGARGRIQSWEACGAVSLTGTRAPEGETGGKPANEYSIADPRILRMAERGLYDPEKLTEAPLDEDD